MNNNFNQVMHQSINWHHYHITRKDREILHQHRSLVLWFTGLSGSGKSTIVNSLEKKLYNRNINTYILDGDNIRYGLCKDLTFSMNDRFENLRRAGAVAKLMIDAGLVVLAAFISPFSAERKMVRNMFSANCFLEVFIDTPIEICEKRDVKGLYRQARLGKIQNFTGIHVPYEKPSHPDVYLDGTKKISELVDKLLYVLNPKILL